MTRDSRWALATITLGVVLIAGLLVTVALDLGASPATIGDSVLVAIPTSDAVPGQACNGALLEGKLVAHAEWGLAVQNVGGEPLLVFWPDGWYGRDRGSHVELVDRDGKVIARTGDHISAGGGGTTVDSIGGFKMCPGGPTVLEPVQPQSAALAAQRDCLRTARVSSGATSTPTGAAAKDEKDRHADKPRHPERASEPLHAGPVRTCTNKARWVCNHLPGLYPNHLQHQERRDAVHRISCPSTCLIARQGGSRS